MKIKIQENNSGFTLIEMVVVMAIFSILTSVVVFNYGDFNNNIISTNLTYEIALTVREAQVYALGVRGAESDFNTRYGAYFNIDPTNGNGKNFMLFADINEDGKCEIDGALCSISNCIASGPLGDDSCRELSSLTRGVEIVDLCVANGVPISEDGVCTQGVNSLSVTFERPNPDALVYSGGTEYSDAAIIIEAPNSSRRAVLVRSTGQISVEVF